MIFERGISVSYETNRVWYTKFGAEYARRLKRCRGRVGDTWHLDEVFLKIDGRNRCLWRAVDQQGEVIHILVQSHRDARAAQRFFKKLLKAQSASPRRVVTDRLGSYEVAIGALRPDVEHI
jgi:putative transposase